MDRLPELIIENGEFKDSKGRTVILRGINVAGDAKYPVTPFVPSHHEDNDEFWDGDNVSFVNSPFSLDQADEHFARLKVAGFKLVRYIFTWEALEHQGPAVYDDEFIDFTISVLQKLRHHGLYCFMDPHQDVWSRFSGGSGAPLWTFYAAGLNPRHFKQTKAAVLYNNGYAEDELKMIWSSNYHRLACETMFTLFFAGEEYAPKCTINGLNIQHYLQQHFINAIKHFATKVRNVRLDDVILGWESMNEPSEGLIGRFDLSEIPASQNVKLGACPTPFQSMVLGAGNNKVTVDMYEFSSVGPRKQARPTMDIDPNGVSAWLSAEEAAKIDEKYRWTRSMQWTMGTCIWKLHGVWKNNDRLIKPEYFAYDSKGKPFENGERAFVDIYLVKHVAEYFKMINSINKSWMLFLQPPVNTAPSPSFSEIVFNYPGKVVYTPHFYDGLTIMLKRWSRFYNVDALGILRNQYPNPVFGLRLGEWNIRACLDSQLRYLKSECQDLLKDVCVLVSEIGIPYDMDDHGAYRSGDYCSQIRAMDAINHALESAKLSHTLWVYSASNCHEFGDNWNGEDLSIWSKDDSKTYDDNDNDDDPHTGLRAKEAIIRPYPLAVAGDIESYNFHMTSATFSLAISARHVTDNDNEATEIFLPRYYFPQSNTAVSTSSGTWKYNNDSQVLVWKHTKGSQSIKIKGQVKFVKDPGCVIA